MKKIKFLSLVLVALSAILFISCSKDDDGGNSNVQKNEIYGEWEMIHISSVDEGDSSKDFERDFNSSCRSVAGFGKKGDYTFTKKEVDEETKECKKGNGEVGTYRIEGNNLFLKTGKEAEDMGKIIQLSKKSLIIVMVSTYDKDGKQFKTTVTTVYERKK
ncbi:lipocalin family protein [Ornithobacterium rhinotracheale]|uniref:lipocalin family protein n=1 Tax=Ornithobacterium rhinotracheale TaxID=28251 RepID=UPI001FF125D8|nr:lipocalin family protein [Ornithobacterium rhinotracheale]MCK0203723.1 lipocalin family protein [Ornithobacterium rhinotracheale]MCK0205132.1 lipocalin family protein [Ornithobacterium rhinotracheale]